jgi:ABC-type multidrug transport system fused ATPase/permease subunit
MRSVEYQPASLVKDSMSSFVIAYCLSIIRDIGQVIVIDKGEIVEQGNRQQLLDTKDSFDSLYAGQFKRISIYSTCLTFILPGCIEIAG